MIYLGNFAANSTIYFPFDTYGSSGESITMSGLAVTDIEIYKNGSTTQRASDNGYTLLDTDGIDFDGVTGLHGFSIDLSDNSDSGFYAAGSTYWVNVNAITINSQTVRFTFYFTIGVPAANVTQWLGTACATPTTAGVPEVDLVLIDGAVDAGDFGALVNDYTADGGFNVSSMSANTLTASALASDAVTEIAAGVGAGATTATLANQQAILAKINPARVTAISPVTQNNDITLDSGDDYDSADGTALEWTAVDQWSVFSGGTLTLQVQPTDEYEAGTGTWATLGTGAITQSSTDAVLKVSIGHADTAALETAPTNDSMHYVYRLRVTQADSDVITVAKGSLTVRR